MSISNCAQQLARLRSKLIEIPPADAAHDVFHCDRVATLFIRIYADEMKTLHNRDLTEIERDCCRVTALLHDCYPVSKDSPLRKKSAKLSATRAAEWLKEVCWVDLTEEIIAAIRDHSFSAGRIPASLFGKCFQDADRMESLGAIGMYRLFATGVSMQASFFNSSDPWAKDRPLDDRKYSLDHFFTKLLLLPDTFHTSLGRIEAQNRSRFLHSFLQQLRQEIDH